MTRRDHGWTWVQEFFQSDWFLKDNLYGMDDPLRTAQCFGRYLKNGKFSDNELKNFLPSIITWWRASCRRHGTQFPEPPQALMKKIGG